MPTSLDNRAAAIELKGVSAGYGAVAVLRDIDMTVGREVVAVVGPNGAGKSTLLKTVLGVLRPIAGAILLDGELISGMTTDQIARRGVGYVPQVRDVFDTMTVRENLEMGGYRLPARSVAKRVSEIFELYPALAAMSGRHGGYLSGGERKMLAMGKALMPKPSVLVLDEPTAGLSPQLAHELLSEHVAKLASTGVAILLVEQHAREALTIADRGYVLAGGQVVLSDAAPALLARADIHEVFLGRVSTLTG